MRVFSKWGTWQQARPDVAAGLKRGFTFCFHRPGERFADDDSHARQLLVAASPHDAIADTHWYRPDFDLALVRQAEAAGVTYLDDIVVERMDARGPAKTLICRRGNDRHEIGAGFVVDASGPRGFMHRLLGLDERASSMAAADPGSLRALHRVVDRAASWLTPDRRSAIPARRRRAASRVSGGWIWVLRFNNGVTSAGAALTDAVAREIAAADGAPAWDRLLATLPSVREQFRNARAVHPFVHAPRIAYRSAVVHGDGWAMLPSAAGVIDPLLSTGFPLTLLGIMRLARHPGTTRRHANDSRPSSTSMRASRSRSSTRRSSSSPRSTRSWHDPQIFKRLSLLYFAAASFSEAARRLGKPELAPGFLLCRHAAFAREMSAIALAAGSADGRGRDGLLARIDRAIEPFDVAGLRDRTRRDWYPVRADDLLAARARLDASDAEIVRTAGTQRVRAAGAGGNGRGQSLVTVPSDCPRARVAETAMVSGKKFNSQGRPV